MLLLDKKINTQKFRGQIILHHRQLQWARPLEDFNLESGGSATTPLNVAELSIFGPYLPNAKECIDQFLI